MHDLPAVKARIAALIEKLQSGGHLALAPEEWMELGELEKVRNALSYREPRFQLKEVLSALGDVKQATVRNWFTRKQLVLDAESVREGEGWRAFSIRDVLVLAICHRLSALGFPASLLQKVVDQIDPWVTNPHGHFIDANRPSYIIVLCDGSVVGLFHSDNLPISELEADHFIVVRLDRLIRTVLEPLGVTITYGNADDHAKAADRIRRATRQDGE